MRGIDLSSWETVLSTLFGLAVVTLVGVSLRLLVMQTVQRRRERQNRQINERLRTLIAAYKTLGGSFTGDLRVDPTHRRELAKTLADGAAEPPGAERRRRIRDAVEAALSDVVLLGTAEQVGLAIAAVDDLVAGRSIDTAPLVVSLRDFIREALDLDPLPDLPVPRQGPARSAGGGSGRAKEAGTERGSGGGGGGAGGGGGGGDLLDVHDETGR